MTPREYQLLKLLAAGKSNKECGSVLAISPKTVERHRQSLYRKLGISSLAQLVHYALARGHVVNIFDPVNGKD